MGINDPRLRTMSEEVLRSFLQSALKQVKINRLMHEGDENAVPQIMPEQWAMIVAVHAGHLTEAVLEGDDVKVERELLHVAAPLLELYLVVKGGKGA
ncbi:hypothetical protein [Desulfofundulus sp.]|uniref:hypothetical protein n=1 Tax=Desulfofundulus sp. TaxID=2282750 RepID=UPI003C727368